MNGVVGSESFPATRLADGPSGHFLVGSIPDFIQDPLSFLMRMQAEFGEMARYRLGNIRATQVNHPEGVQRILQENNHNYIKGDYWAPIRQVGGEGLFTSEGAHWLRQRRLMQPAFHRQRIAGFAEIMTGRTLDMLARWEAAARLGQLLDISQEFTDLTMKVISEAMFSTRMDEDTQAISQALTWLLEDINYRFEVPFYPKIGFPTARNLRAKRELAVVDRVIYAIIEQRRRSGDQKDDLLGLLMSARDEDSGEAMSDRQLRDEVITIFVAGHETTAVLLTWLFHSLHLNPEVGERMYAEAEAALGGRLPGFADLVHFSYIRMAIDETLRLYPPVWITSRTSLEEDEICGCRIPAGEVVMVSPYVTHRLPEYWPDPDRFDPERFSPEHSADRPRYAYMPFGGGPRQCIGNNFALVEAQLIFATIAGQFRLRAAADKPVIIKPSVTLRPKNGMWMTVHPR